MTELKKEQEEQKKLEKHARLAKKKGKKMRKRDLER